MATKTLSPDGISTPTRAALLRHFGRTISIVQMPDGSILISDDVGVTIWRVRYTGDSVGGR